jgi:hypothetical protein
MKHPITIKGDSRRAIGEPTVKSLRNVPDEIWWRVRFKCVQKGLKIYEGVNEALENWVKQK